MKIDFLRGHKTYVTAALAVIGALAAMLVGDTSAVDGAQIIVTALLGAFIRHGVTSDAGK